MFGPITIPYECVMLYNTATLKSEIDFDDVEFALAEMCSLVKETYPDFIAGQVFKFEGFISTEGTVGSDSKDKEHIAIVTYWKSFEAHEESHANEKFKEAFTNLMQYCTDTKELGYKLLWQGEQE
jgi:heme-degrading monooxygenase HmoA